MSLVRIPPPRPNLWCCSNLPPAEVFIRGSDGEQHCRTSKRTCRQNEEDTHDDIFGTPALALVRRRLCRIEADDDTKARIFGEISAPDEFCLPVLTNFACRDPRMNPCRPTWEQYLRNSCFTRTPLELRRILEDEDGAGNWNCNGCPRLPPICPQHNSCHPPVNRGRPCCTNCLQYLPFCHRLVEATNVSDGKCCRNNPADIYWLGNEKTQRCCCRLCGQTCLGRHALDFAEARCPPLEVPNQLFWLGNPACNGPSALLQGRGSSWASVESWPFGGFSKQPYRIDANFSRYPRGSFTSSDYESPNNQRVTEISSNSSVPTLSKTSMHEPSRTKPSTYKTRKVANRSPSKPPMDVKESKTVIKTTTSECDYQQPQCPQEDNDC